MTMKLIDLSDGWKGSVSVADTIEEKKRVPADKKFVLLSVRIVNNDEGNGAAADGVAEIFISEGAAGAVANRMWHETVSPGSDNAYNWQGLLHLKEADRISVRCDNTAVRFHISGIGDLEDPPI